MVGNHGPRLSTPQQTWNFPAFPKKTWDLHGFPGVSKKKQGKPAQLRHGACWSHAKLSKAIEMASKHTAPTVTVVTDGDGNSEDMVGLWLMQTRCDDHHAPNKYIIYIYVYIYIYI